MRFAGLAWRVLAVSCAVLAGVACSCGAASAALTHNFVSSFGSFASVQGIALDGASGDVYVYDASAGSVLKFDASGKPANFTSTGTNTIGGVGSVGEGEGELAVDNSTSPAKGDIYVANGGHIGIYSSSGEALGELTAEAGKPWGEPCGVAVDASGEVYVGLWNGGPGFSYVNKYVPTGNPAVGRDYVSSLTGVSEVCNLTVGNEGSVYTDTWPEGPIKKYENWQFSAGAGMEIAGGGRALTVDPTTNDLYVARYGEVAQFEPSGALVDTFAGAGGNAFGNAHGVAVNGTSGDVYVSDNEHGRVEVFGPAVTVADVVTGQPTNLAPTSATLNGTVNPEGMEVTACEFEYGTTNAYGQSAPCNSTPGSGSSQVAVQAAISGLTPHTAYHYRLVATDADGTSRGADVEFTSPGPPIVDEEVAMEVNVSSAKLRTSINPSGLATTYSFEYGIDTAYGSTAPIPAGEIGAQQGDVQVSQQIIELQPGATYHYRVLATNSAGTTYGQDETFTTLPAAAPKSVDTCPNAAHRVFAAANLPDCRAYEMVSPVEKNGADVVGQELNEFVASSSGERVAYATHIDMPEATASGSGGFSQYIASRAPTGEWVTKGISPEVASGTPYLPSNTVLAFTDQLDRAFTIGYELPEGSGGVPNTDNFYIEDPFTAKITETITRDEGSESINGFFFPWTLRAGGASSDLGVTTFESTYNLTPQATGNVRKLYVVDHGTIQLAGVLPNESLPAGGSSRAWKGLGNQGEDPLSLVWSNTVSEDGSRILFTSPAEGSTSQLYMRKNEAKTVWVSRSEASTPVSEPVNVRFQAATPDDKHILFTSDTPLLDNDPGGSGTGLYMYTDSPEPETESNLTFIARVRSVDEYNERQQVVSAVSNDGSYVYFSSGPSESLPESESGGFFVWHEGKIAPVALGINKTGRFGGQSLREAEISQDGKKFVFVSGEKLLPGQTILSLDGESKIGMASHFFLNSELYIYDSDTASLKCVSCPPSGDAITHGAEVANVEIPAAPIGFQIGSHQRYFSSNGKYVFFNTVEALLPQDTNGLTDAYEYNVETGQLSLLSPGTGENPTWFVEASPDGHDVFLLTREKLKRQDVDNLADLYDARIEGGQPEPPPPGNPCAGDACQGTPSAVPSFATASEFLGRGNPPKTTTASTVHRGSVTRSQKLKRALKACQRKSTRKRARCDARARKLYAGKKHSKRAGR